MTGHESWLEEKQSAWLYRRVAAAETDLRMRKLFLSLAEAAEAQAKQWSGEKGEPDFVPSLRARVTAILAERFGPRSVRSVLSAMKIRGLSAYDARTPGNGGTHAMPSNVQDIGQRHKRFGGGNLRAAVFGVSDGLISNTSLLMGMAGATAQSDLLITTGIAGLLAGALSMAAGEYTSVRSQREMYEYQIGLEKDELNKYPEEEAEELALIYEARGISLARARELASDLMRDPENALNALAREELGLNPDDLGSPWGAACFSFVSFAVGAIVPMLPLIGGATGQSALAFSAAAAGVALLMVGGALSLFSGRSALYGAFRMLLIGGGAGVATYLIGTLFGTALS
jgi:vacuolar iron transporter family protein